MSKPVKKTVSEIMHHLPAHIIAAIEEERTKEQLVWIDATADLIRSATGLPNDIAFVATSRSRLYHTAETKARNIAEILGALQDYQR